MREHLLQLAHYNLWANQKLVNNIIPNDEFIWEREVKSSFNTIGKTILHIADAQDIWLSRLNGESLTNWPSSNLATELPAAIGHRLIESSHRFFAFMDVQLPSYPTKIIQYENMKGITFYNTVEEIVAHVMNHSTFHRGQVITLLRELGIDKLTSTDLITFFREIKEKKKDVLD